MKHFLALILSISTFFVASANSNEKILSEISEMEEVEAVFITKSMLISISKNNNYIGKINISKIAKDLTSIQMLTISGKSLPKARQKMRSLKNYKKMDVIMRLKESNENTEILGTKLKNGNYSSILMTIDNKNEINIIYLVGDIGQNCLDELSKNAGFKVSSNASTSSQDFFYIDWNNIENYNTHSNGKQSESSYKFRTNTEYDEQISAINDSIKEFNEYSKRIEKEELAPLNDKITAINVIISQTKSRTELDKLFKQRKELHSQRNKIYEKRNNIYHKRYLLYNKLNQLKVKKYTID